MEEKKILLNHCFCCWYFEPLLQFSIFMVLFSRKKDKSMKLLIGRSDKKREKHESINRRNNSNWWMIKSKKRTCIELLSIQVRYFSGYYYRIRWGHVFEVFYFFFLSLFLVWYCERSFFSLFFVDRLLILLYTWVYTTMNCIFFTNFYMLEMYFLAIRYLFVENTILSFIYILFFALLFIVIHFEILFECLNIYQIFDLHQYIVLKH